MPYEAGGTFEKRLRDLKLWWNLSADPDLFGGFGGGYRDFMVAIEEVGAACGSSSTVLITHVSLGSQTINHGGNKEQRQRWLPSLASGEKIAAFALTEPGTGSDALALETSLTRDGAEYVLNGTKLFITNGAEADIFSIFTNHDKSAGHRGVTAVVVEKGTPGFTINPQHGKMGMKGCATAELVFEDCRVPRTSLIGAQEGRGLQQILAGLELGRINIAARGVGIARACLDESIAYAQLRRSFGKPICEHQAIQMKLADMATRVEAARLLTESAAQAYDSGERCDMEAGMAKLHASEAAISNSVDAMRIHGAYGYSREFNIERYYRDAPLLAIGEGTNELQRIIISRQLIERNKV